MNVMNDKASSIREDEDRIDTKKTISRIINHHHSSHKNKVIENVLILQGGGSLGAFGCGVFKALSQKNVKIDIVAGTSIGGVNAAIIAGSKNEKHPEQFLEEFWLELADSFVDWDNFFPFCLPFFEQMISNYYYYSYSSSTSQQKENDSIRKIEEYRNKAITDHF